MQTPKKEKKRKDKKKRKSEFLHGHRNEERDDSLSKKPKKQRIKNDSALSTTTTTTTATKAVKFPHCYILAPMVGASELAFRLLCRRYGCQAAYTPMMSAQKFANDEDYRKEEFQTCPEDRPLVCHFAANTPDDFAAAARQAEPFCDAIDLNLGCPQRTAYLGHFGSYLLDEKDRNLVCSIVTAGAKAVDIPIFCKIRLLDTLDETIRLCKGLRDAGASLIAVHGRYRASWERKGPGARDGPALMDQIGEIKKAIPQIPIIANGNTITFEDVEDNLKLTQADGLMSAEGILDNPALFLPRLMKDGNDNKDTVKDKVDSSQHAENTTKIEKLKKKLRKIVRIEKKVSEKGIDALNQEDRKRLSKKSKIESALSEMQGSGLDDDGSGPASYDMLEARADDKLGIANEYLDLVEKHPVKMRSVIFHTRRILKTMLEQYQLMEDCLACTSLIEIRAILDKMKHYQQNPEAFVFDKDKQAREKEALERKRREEGKRKAYEARMVRKAKREGKKDLQYYLHIGAEVPSQATITKLKALPRKDALDLWKKQHSQHCLAFHLESEGCVRGRTCAFLHVDVVGSNTFEEKDEVAG